MSRKKFLLLLVVVAISCSRFAPAYDCLCVVEVGSGTTRITALSTDATHTVLYTKEVAIPFERWRLASGGILPEAKVALAGRLLRRHLADIPSRYRCLWTGGFATAAFRKASNGATALTLLSQVSGVTLKRITAEEEGRVALASLDGDVPALLDVGASSMQITLKENASERVWACPVGAERARKIACRALKREDGCSPNPMPATLSIDTELYDIFQRCGRIAVPQRIYGTGGVIVHSVFPLTGAQTITRAALASVFQHYRGRSDREWNSPYAATQGTNILLIKALMDYHSIEEIVPIHLTMARGWVRLHASGDTIR